MSSKIDPSGINPNYPVASTNQSSQGFRDNFKAIQNALVQAKTESTLILGTTITVTGQGIDPFTSTSIQVGNGNIPLELNLGTQSGVSDGDYDTLTDIVKFNVNSNGILTSISKDDPLTAVDTSKVWNITRCPDDSSFPGQAGMSSFTYPTFQTNTAGRVTSSEAVTVSGLGLLGYSMNKGQLVVGSSSNVSTFLPAGSDNQILVSDSGSSTGLKWATPSGGTVTGVSSGLGLTVTNSGTSPEIDLNISALPDNNTFDSGLIFLTFDSKHSATKWSNITTALVGAVSSAGYMKHLSDDTQPSLGGTLSTNGNNIVSSSSDLTIQSTNSHNLILNSSGSLTLTSTGSLNVNGVTWVKSLPSQSGMTLTSNQDGVLYWSSAGQSVSDLTSSSPLITTASPNGTYNVDFQPWQLSSQTPDSNTMVVATNASSKTNFILNPAQLISSAPITGISYVSPTGNDSTGNGSLFNPYATIGKAISSQATNIILFPGTFSESVTISGSVNIDSLINNQSILSGSITVSGQATLSRIQLGGTLNANSVVTIDSSSINNGATISVGTNSSCSITDTSISGTVNNNSAGGAIDIENCQSPNGFGWTLNSSQQATVSNSNYVSVNHTGGMMEIYNVVYCQGVVSTSNDTDDYLIMRNVSMSNNGSWNAINKSGSCPYILQNVSRLASQDTLSGSRLEFANTDDDIGDQTSVITATGDITLSNNTRVYDITVNTSSSFTINIPIDSYNSATYIRSMTVILRGTSTSAGFGSNTISWPSVTWSGGTQPSWNYNNGKATLFTFVYVSNVGWIGSQSLITV